MYIIKDRDEARLWGYSVLIHIPSLSLLTEQIMSTRGKEVLFSKLEKNSLEMEWHQLEGGAVAELRKHCFNELEGTVAQMLEDFCNHCV